MGRTVLTIMIIVVAVMVVVAIIITFMQSKQYQFLAQIIPKPRGKNL